ncbi:MAG: PAS domain-containing protein [Gemmatimonadetes bacterium]|nr:PAS domain-containing protein [Gemmatimonadota bacterium]
MLLPAVKALAANAVLLLAMVAIYDMVTAKLRPASGLRRDAVLGLLLGGIGIALMLLPYHEAPGIHFDARAVLLGVAGLYAGVVPTVIAMLMTAARRIALGGEGLPMGLASIVTSGAIGIVWHHRRRDQLADLRWPELLALGVAVNVGTLLGTALLPADHRAAARDAMMTPVLLVLPLATMLLGLLMRDRVRRDREFADLAETKTRLALAIAAGRQGTFDLDPATGLAVLSREYVTMLGHDPADFDASAAAWLDRMHPDDRLRIEADFQDVLAGRRLEFQLEFRQRTARGDFIWIHSLGRGIDLGLDGRPRRILGTHTDITERKTAELSARLEMVALDAAADAVVITDRNGVIQWCNPAFLTLSGYTREEALGSSPRVLLRSGAQDPAFYEEMWGTLLRGEVWRGELVNRRKDQSRYVEQQTITPVSDPNGVVTHFIAIKRDVTAQRRFEAQFHQSQKMESVGRLAGSVAHDFNNLLTVINSSIDLAQAALPPDHEARPDLKEAERAGARAVLLTRQLLGFSRQQPAKVARVDLAEVVRGLLPMLERLIGENIEIETRFAENLPPVLIDRGQMEQVVMNLAINGRDAMPDGGTLTIAMANTRLPSEDGGSWVELTVRDTGMGMDAEAQEHLFEPFFTTKEAGKGTGLGLATCLGIITGAGGRITALSTPGRGTSFTIRLPGAGAGDDVAAPLPAAPQPTLPAPLPLDGGSATVQRILVVDDEEPIRRVMRRVLERSGFEVIEAVDGAEALAAIATHRGSLALMITDMMMPGLGGGDLVASLRAGGSTMPVILTSGYSVEFTRERAGVGADVTIVSKPFMIDQLLATVRSVLAATN